PLVIGFVARNRHPAIAGGHLLGLLKTETPNVPDGADVFALVFGEMGLRTILNQRYSMPLRDLYHGVHVAWIAEKVHQDDRACARRYFSLYIPRVHVVGVVDIGKYRNTVLVQNGDDGAQVGYRRGDDLIAWIEIQRAQRYVNSSSPRSRGHTIRHTIGIRELFLERRNHLATDATEVLGDQSLTQQFELLDAKRMPALTFWRRAHHPIEDGVCDLLFNSSLKRG